MTKCKSCKHSIIASGNANGIGAIELLGCHVFNSRIETDIEHCTAYENKMEKDVYDLEKIAWIMEVSKGQPIGFISPIEWRKKNPRSARPLGDINV